MSDSTALPLTTVANTARVPVAPIFDGTDNYAWRRPLNPELGMSELEWLENNRDGLTGYMGRWVAVLDGQIITSAESANEVYEHLKAGNIGGALITFVQGIPNRWDNLIA